MLFLFSLVLAFRGFRAFRRAFWAFRTFQAFQGFQAFKNLCMLLLVLIRSLKFSNILPAYVFTLCWLLCNSIEKEKSEGRKNRERKKLFVLSRNWTRDQWVMSKKLYHWATTPSYKNHIKIHLNVAEDARLTRKRKRQTR